MKNKSKKWIIGYFIIVLVALCSIAFLVIKIDPYFHYHKPDTESFYYVLNNQRNQNDGITKHFDYDAIITGTSMTENFKTSELDQLFGTESIKVNYAGATYKEINDNLKNGFNHNKDIKMIVRSLDMDKIIRDKDEMRSDLGKFPSYLYDDLWINDAEYVFNRDVVFSRVLPMIRETQNEGFEPGITSFDSYANWMGNGYHFGINSVDHSDIDTISPGEPVYLTAEEKQMVTENVKQNIVNLAMNHPETDFYYFLTPYSAIWWGARVNDGTIYKQIEAESMLIEEVIKCNNIKLFSFNILPEITTDINNYKDITHYGEWVNSFILNCMKEGRYQLTESNYMSYLNQEQDMYLSLDYSGLMQQEDYDNDYFAGVAIAKYITGKSPQNIDDIIKEKGEFRNAVILEKQHNGKNGFMCTGALMRDPGNEIPMEEYVINTDYNGVKIQLDDLNGYRYLVCYAKKIKDHGQPEVFVYDDSNNLYASLRKNYKYIGDDWELYIIDISGITDKATIIFDGGYSDNSGDPDSSLIFSDISLY